MLSTMALVPAVNPLVLNASIIALADLASWLPVFNTPFMVYRSGNPLFTCSFDSADKAAISCDLAKRLALSLTIDSFLTSFNDASRFTTSSSVILMMSANVSNAATLSSSSLSGTVSFSPLASFAMITSILSRSDISCDKAIIPSVSLLNASSRTLATSLKNTCPWASSPLLLAFLVGSVRPLVALLLAIASIPLTLAFLILDRCASTISITFCTCSEKFLAFILETILAAFTITPFVYVSSFGRESDINLVRSAFRLDKNLASPLRALILSRRSCF